LWLPIDRTGSLVAAYAHHLLADLLRSGDVPRAEASACADKGWRVVVIACLLRPRPDAVRAPLRRAAGRRGRPAVGGARLPRPEAPGPPLSPHHRQARAGPAARRVRDHLLNRIERFWRLLRRRATHNRLFDSAGYG
jgi:hypothetical protein